MQPQESEASVVPRALEDLAQPHIESFDFFISDGLRYLVDSMNPVEVIHPTTGEIYQFWINNLSVLRPVKEDAAASLLDTRLLPRECREAGTTYRAPLMVEVGCSSSSQQGGSCSITVTKRVGQLPIMVKSQACYLKHMKRDDLIRCKEEGTEFGGYFICNGIERIIRMLILTRRHYIMALKRSAYRKRGPSFSDFATSIRCVRRDESSVTNRCHYLSDGNAVFSITLNKAEYFVPAGILLKCLGSVSDQEIYHKIVGSCASDAAHMAFVSERAEILVKSGNAMGFVSQKESLDYLGSLFRGVLNAHESKSDYEVGKKLIEDNIFIHLDDSDDKLELGYQMICKLYAVVNGQCVEDNPDALTHQEVLLPGHLLLKFMREQMEVCLDTLKDQVERDLEKSPGFVNLQDDVYLKKCLERWPDVGQKFEYLLNTGNMASRSGLDLSQSTGFTVVAEKLNFYRYLSHFRSIHRGAYFAELRTTAVRKLLPESWGFMCPVHTPDGSPCGLLNHLTTSCFVVCEEPEAASIEVCIRKTLHFLGMSAIRQEEPIPSDHVAVFLDGKVIGSIRITAANAAVSHLRSIKASRLALQVGLSNGASVIELEDHEMGVPENLEIVYFPPKQGGTYFGLYLFSQAARMMRPVMQRGSKATELIGTLEQSLLSIRCPDGQDGGSRSLKFTHEEFGPQQMLSVVASLTPYSDFNQSPRNMYQCQMAKQTMGTAAQILPHRTDNKLYRLQTPQTPVVRTQRYPTYSMDEFPNGTNAIVAVLAYTGYDMEDAMILNKSSVERGFAHASLYKTESINLSKEKGVDLAFGQGPVRQKRFNQGPPKGAFGAEYPHFANLDQDICDPDGLPHVGAPVWPSESYYSSVDKLTGKTKAGKLKGEETAVVDQVTIIGHGKDKNIKHANIKLRFNRNPVIGDKFSSRHGQKGVLSRLYDDVDMPFCESTGVRPDLLINPHAFPSRMTIGMLIESLTGKAGAVTGKFVDASPFQTSDKKDTDGPVEDIDVCRNFCDALEAAGFSKSGGETMVCGVTGELFQVETYIGVVYYQRLRHMVSDKFQVRSTGPINPLTRQPIKGRKFGGGIRFGEMERDSLLAHGAAYLLHDRLHACSDYHVTDVCAHCGLLVSTVNIPHAASSASGVSATKVDGTGSKGNVICRLCGTGKHIERVALPYVFKYLVSELTAMNIRCSLSLKT